MPIKGMTDRQTLKPRLPRLGKLRKGGEKSGNKPGEDLDHFRFDSDNAAVVDAFSEAYGDSPRVVNAIFYGDTVEEVFPTWIEAWDASGLIMRSDGEHWVLWRDGDQYKRAHRPHQDVEGQSIVGRLEFLVPELLAEGIVGTVTLVTHSNNDIRNIAAVLATIEQERGGLRGAQVVIRRVKESISTPGWGDRKGQRSRTDKWLVKIELPRAMFAALEAADQTRAALPAPPSDYVEGDYVDEEPETAPSATFEHWLDYVDPQSGKVARTRFWGYAKGTLGLTDEQVHDALGVESVKDFRPNAKVAEECLAAMSEAKKLLDTYKQNLLPEEPQF